MENNTLHVVKLSGHDVHSGVSPVRLSGNVPSHGSPQILPKRNTVHEHAPIRLSYNQTKISERKNLRFVENQKIEVRHTSFRRQLSFGSGLFSKFAVLMLIPMLLVYPIIPVYAADDEVTPPPSMEADTPIASDEGESNVIDTPTVPPEVPVSDAGLTVAEFASSTEDSSILIEESITQSQEATTTAETPTDVADEDVRNEGDTSSSTEETNVSRTESASASSTENMSTSSALEINSNVDEATSTETLSSEIAETPPETPAETPEAIASRMLNERESVLRNEIRKEVETEFTKRCVTMDSVGFYCLKDGEGKSADVATPADDVVTRVEAVQGTQNAFKQISMTRGGESVEITNDAWDNAFPTTDVSGKSLVWQGNVDGRWQIFFADASGTGTPRIVQVTHSSESNFNPRVDGKDVVWQAWVEGNWEIYHASRLDPSAYPALEEPLSQSHTMLGIDRTWGVERITTNTMHDMFPSLSGGLITWQSFQGGTWNVFAYSLKTKSVVKLSRDGAKSEHPRFSITWDERGDDGQTRMMGYDIATGKVVDITGEARNIPDDTKPYQPEAPISKDNQATLPISTGTSTATSTRADGDGDGATGNGLDI